MAPVKPHAVLECAVLAAILVWLHVAKNSPLTLSMLVSLPSVFMGQAAWDAHGHLGLRWRSGASCGLVAGGFLGPVVISSASLSPIDGIAALVAVWVSALGALQSRVAFFTALLFIMLSAAILAPVAMATPWETVGHTLLWLMFGPALPCLLPHGMTPGEALAAGTGLVLLAGEWAVAIAAPGTIQPITAFCLVASGGAGIIGFTLGILSNYLAFKPPGVRAMVFFGLCLVYGLGICWPLLSYMSQQPNPMRWFMEFFTGTPARPFLVLYWVVLFLIAVGVVVMTASERRKNNIPCRGRVVAMSHPGSVHHRIKIIRIRKAFHALAVAAYVPGLVCEPGLLRLASAGALALFVLLECCRALNVPPLARSLEAGLRPFVDSRDSGRLILTHIYLLLGLSAPIWLAARQSDTAHGRLASLAPYAGVLSVGLGDAVAALAGSSLGRIHWPGTSKTLEGTTFSLLTQLALALVILGPSLDVVLPLAASLGLVCLLEAFTEQIDNMLLPLYLFALFTV
uniref:dolichol kinase n=1 Tax=Myxine glutinosa TaxID=7769 RepID=UPI00358FBC36